MLNANGNIVRHDLMNKPMSYINALISQGRQLAVEDGFVVELRT